MRNSWRRGARWGSVVVVAFASIFLALLVTPRATVSTFGQTVEVGAVPPPAALSWSGPGKADLFGEGPVSTVQHFNGFIRPLIVWRRFDQTRAASQFIQPGAHRITPSLEAEISRAGQSLASGWAWYLVQLVLLAGLMGVALHLLVVGGQALFHHHEHQPARRSVLQVIRIAALSAAVTAAFAGMTVVSAYQQLQNVHALADLVGTSRLAPVAPAAGPVSNDVGVVVMGDSTAAGEGNPLVPNPSDQDRACSRSQDSYAHALQQITGSRVLNLACSSATIADGLLGSQGIHGQTMLPQVSRLKSVPGVKAVIVSIGANDVGWTDFVRYCAVAPQCGDLVSAQLFRSRLDRFKIQYAQLLQQLADLPGQPTVIINEYYDPLGSTVDCLLPATSTSSPGATSSPGSATPESGLAANLDTLKSEINDLNAVLAKGADAFNDVVVQPDFTGHTVCADQPWVQGIHAAAPLHPNAAGELAIAAADLPRLLEAIGKGASQG